MKAEKFNGVYGNIREAFMGKMPQGFFVAVVVGVWRNLNAPLCNKVFILQRLWVSMTFISIIEKKLFKNKEAPNDEQKKNSKKK